MARVSTKTGLINLSLSLLKIPAITEIDPLPVGNKAAAEMALWYDDCRRETLSENIFDHAVKRVSIASDATAPAFGYGSRYLLPSDFIRVATIGAEYDPEEDYEIEAGYILTDVGSPLNLRYVFDHQDILQMPPKFIMAFSAKLAQKTAYPITGNRSMVQEMALEYEKAVSDAQAIDGQNNAPRQIQRSKWTQAKYLGSVSRRWW